MKISLKKRGNMFYPSTINDVEAMKTLPTEYEILVDISRPRNPKNHNRYFVFLRVAFDLQETFSNVEQLRHYLQMRAGHYEPMVTHKGKTIYRPLSIAWEKISEDDFQKLFKEVVTAFLDFYDETHDKPLSEEELMRILDFQ